VPLFFILWLNIELSKYTSGRGSPSDCGQLGVARAIAALLHTPFAKYVCGFFLRLGFFLPDRLAIEQIAAFLFQRLTTFCSCNCSVFAASHRW